MSTETVVAIIAALGTILGGGGLAGLVANRQLRRSEARSKAAEGEVSQSAEARQWAAMARDEATSYRAKLEAIHAAHDFTRTAVLLCGGAGGQPCPTREVLLTASANVTTVTPDPPSPDTGPAT